MKALSRKERVFNYKKENGTAQIKALYKNINHTLEIYNNCGYCTPACFDLKKMQILLQMSVYEGFHNKSNGHELLDKLLTDNEVSIEDMNTWLKVLMEEHREQTKPNWVITEESERIAKITLENQAKPYKVGVTPNPVLCLIVAKVAMNPKVEENLILFFKSMDKMLTAFNQEKNSKFASTDSFDFLRFSKSYGWPVDIYERNGITKKEHFSLKSALRSKDIRLEQLAVEFEAEKQTNQILVSNAQSLHDEISELKNKYIENCEEIAVLNEHVRQKSLEKGVFARDAEKKKKEIEITNLKIKAIAIENETIKKEFALKEKQYKEQILHHENRIQEIETIGKNYRAQIEALTVQKEKLFHESQQYLKQIEELNFKLSRAVAEKEVVDIKNLELHKELNLQKSNLTINALKIEELNKELQKVLLKVTDHEKENSSLQNSLRKISIEYEELNNRFQQSIVNALLLEKQLKEFELKLTTQVREKSLIESNFSELKVSYKSLSEKCEKSNQQILLLSNQLTEKSHEYTKLIDTHKEVIEPTIKSQLEELEKSSLMYSQACNEIASLNQTISSNSQQANSKLIQLQELLKTTTCEKDQVIMDYENAVIEIRNLKQEAEEKNKSSLAMIKENYLLKEQVSEINTEKHAQEIELKQLKLDKFSLDKKYQEQLELNSVQFETFNQEHIVDLFHNLRYE